MPPAFFPRMASSVDGESGGQGTSCSHRPIVGSLSWLLYFLSCHLHPQFACCQIIYVSSLIQQVLTKCCCAATGMEIDLRHTGTMTRG